MTLRRRHVDRAGALLRQIAWAVVVPILFVGSAAAVFTLEERAQLQQRDEMWEQSHYEEALAITRNLLVAIEKDPRSQPWKALELEFSVAALEHVLGLPPEQRAEYDATRRLNAEIYRRFVEKATETAVALTERQVTVYERLLGPGNFESVNRWNLIATRLLAAGQYARAEIYACRALDALVEAVGREDPEVARTLETLSWALSSQGRATEAERACLEGLVIRRKLYDARDQYVAHSMNQLGIVYLHQGRYTESEALLRETMRIRQEMKYNPGVIEQSMHSLGLLLITKGDYEEAERLLRELLVIRRARLEESDPAIAANLNLLGAALRGQGEMVAAIAFFREQVELNRKFLGPHHPETIKSIDNLAITLGGNGDRTSEEALLREVLQNIPEDQPDVPQEFIYARLDLANVLLATDRLSEAEWQVRQAIERARAVTPGEQILSRALTSLGRCLLARGKYVAADEALTEAVDLYETARARAGSGWVDLRRAQSPHAYLAAARLLSGRTADAWPATEKALGRILSNILLASDERWLSSADAARGDSLRGHLTQLQTQVAVLEEAVDSGASPEVARSLQTAQRELLAAESVRSKYQQEIAAKYPVTQGTTYTLEGVQRSLPEDRALIGWLSVPFGNNASYTWGYVIRKSGPVRWVHLDRQKPGTPKGPTYLQRTRAFRDKLVVAASWPARIQTTREISQDATALGSRWVAPLLPHLEGITHLVVIPSGPLLGIPVEALCDSDGKPIVERFAVSYAPSATLYTWLREHRVARRPTASLRALLVGDPQSGADAPQAWAATDTSSQLSALVTRDLTYVTDQGVAPGSKVREGRPNLARLPKSREEIEQIAKVLPDATILLGPDASEQTIVNLAEEGILGTADIIHIASHALVAEEDFRQSGLILSRANLPDPLAAAMVGERVWDGILTVKEILGEWKLQANLVTLSACQTALGKELPGEGYVGFATAFLEVGARSLLASLWKVDDEATALLMSRFYENLAGAPHAGEGSPRPERMSKAAALGEAKQWLRAYVDAEGTQPFRHPAYWSAFVLMGEAN